MSDKKISPELIQAEIQTSVSLTSFLTAVTIFFVGLLITQFNSFEPSIKIPILFLIISTFGFLYSTLIYANASGKVSRLNQSDVNKDIVLGM